MRRPGLPEMETNEKVEILERFFAAIQAADLATVEAIYHPGCVIWHNHDNATQTVAENLPVLAWVSRKIRDVSYDEVRRTPMASGQVVQEHVLHGTAPNGKTLAIAACIVFSFSEDGRIIRLEEYLDSAQVAVLSE